MHTLWVAVIALSLCVSLCHSNDYPNCRFAPLFNAEDILKDPKTQDAFLHYIAYWEGHFHQDGMGYNAQSGLTYDGHQYNYTTGAKAGDLHNYSASSKECLHLVMLVKALLGDTRAALFVNYSNPDAAYDTAISILTKKITSYEKFNAQFPGYGGFFPWFNVSDDGIPGPHIGWSNPFITPSLDNGELIWAMIPLIHVLTEKGETDLAARYQAQFDRMQKYAKQMFYLGGGKIAAVTIIANVSATPEEQTYEPQLWQGYLDDPFEGELFTWFMDLYVLNETESEECWVYKRARLQSVDYVAPEGNITVQRGFWFSAHEQWKILLMPYLSVPIANKVFTNCEKVRTIHAASLKIPGLYACSYDVGLENNTDYICTGIEEVSFMPSYTDVITPYGSMHLFLVNLGVGLVWYHNILLGPRMQGPFGSTEAVSINGTAICNLGTWDTKITGLSAMLGGNWELTKKVMEEDGTFERFYYIVNREYSLKFPSLRGEDMEYALPTAQIPTNILGFFECPS